MDFQEFLRFVPKLIDARLPAFDAHIKMAPLERLESLRNSSFGDKKPRMAAVMMLFPTSLPVPASVIGCKFLFISCSSR